MKAQPPSLRVGQGIDIHPLVSGRPCILGGVHIPFDRGLEGHSDADALLHALCDALLGAQGKGDIGSRFPPSDPQWKGCDSKRFVSEIVSEMHKDGWRVLNADCTVLAQQPKLLPHIPAMKQVMSELLRVDQSAVAVKATTTEKLGFVGREEGIVAQAVVLLWREG